MNMQEAGKGHRRPRRGGASTQDVSPVTHVVPDSAKKEAPAGAPRTSLGPRTGDLLTAEQEKLMIEHLPIVRFIARRIHERLPQHVPIEDLYSAGVVGLLDAFSKFDPSKQVQFRSYAAISHPRSHPRQPAHPRLEPQGIAPQGPCHRAGDSDSHGPVRPRPHRP